MDGETGAVDVRYRLTARDVLLVVAEVNRCSKLAAVFGFFVVMLPAFTLPSGDWTSIVVLLLAVGFATGAIPGALSAWSLSRRGEFLQYEWRTVVDADGIATWTPKSEGRTQWSLYKRIRETRTAFVLDMGTGAGSFLPKRAFSPAAAGAIASYAAGAGLLVRGSTWKMPLIGVAIGLLIVVPFLLLLAAGMISLAAATGV